MRSIGAVPLGALLTGCLLMAASAALAAEYYLAPDGNDGAAGDRDHPWRSVAKANRALQPGDTAIFRPGDYVGTIAPQRSGTAEAPITFRAAEPWAAHLVADGVPMLIQLKGHEYLIIEGFGLDATLTGGWFTIDDSHHLAIRGCNMRRSRAMNCLRNCTQVKLLDNVFSKDYIAGDTLLPLNCSQMLIEGNSFTRAGHCPLVLQEIENSVVRSNVFHAEWGRNYTFWASGRLLIEGNIITRARDSAWSADPIAKNVYDDSIFRFNRVFGNAGLAMAIASYIYSDVSPTGLYRYPFRAMNSRFYHNTFTDNLGPAWSLGGTNVSANIFQNNIFYRNDPYGGSVQVIRSDGISGDNQFISNLFRGTEAGQTVVRYRNDLWTAEQANQNTPTFGGYWSEFHGNTDGAPGFVNPDNHDYRLSPASEAIDAGAPLALAIGAGTGTVLPVTDGIPFYDGFGIEGEEGDWIAIGRGDSLAQVERVELRYYRPALLHLDRKVTWADGMPVSLPWAGKAPDLGAYEHGLAHPTGLIALASPATAEPGQPIQFSLDSLGKQIASVTWDYGDGTYSSAVAPKHSYANTGQYGATARARFADGRRGIAALFINVLKRAGPVLPLVQIDFEDATYQVEWGWQMKLYDSNQTGQARIARPEGNGKCMHLFFDKNKRNATTAQIAPGVWDIDAYPLVRFSYRIPRGVPIAIEVNTFRGSKQPGGFILGGTDARPERKDGLGTYRLVDDGQWHDITIDVRAARKACPELTHLHQFRLRTDWQEDRGQEFWLDDFAMLPEK